MLGKDDYFDFTMDDEPWDSVPWVPCLIFPYLGNGPEGLRVYNRGACKGLGIQLQKAFCFTLPPPRSYVEAGACILRELETSSFCERL